MSPELIEIDGKRPIETQGSGDGRRHLRDKSVQIREAGRSEVKILLVDVLMASLPT